MPNSHEMIPRLADATVAEALKSAPIVFLLGPARCGKTTMLKKFHSRKDSEFLPILSKNMNWDEGRTESRKTIRFLAKNRSKFVRIDDMQFLPKFAGILSAEIEQDRRPGRFLVAAQRSKKFRKEFGKFGEGVVKTVEITPLRVGEVSGREALEKLWLRGGFPESYFAESEAASIEWRRRYPEAVMAGNAKFHTQGLTAEMLRKLLEVFVAYHGTITKHKSIQDAVGLCLNTVKSYMQLMEDSGMIRSLPSNSLGSDSAHFKYPKHYVRDTGLFHELLGIRSSEQLRNHKLFKLSWETFAIENIISSMPGWAPSYYLTRNRTGVELVLERGERRKLFTFRTDEGPEPTPSFERFSREFTNEPATIVTPPNDRYPEAYPICRAIRVMTLPAFCKEALENKDGSSS